MSIIFQVFLYPIKASQGIIPTTLPHPKPLSRGVSAKKSLTEPVSDVIIDHKINIKVVAHVC